jgi:hypothetical protein
VNDSSTHDIDIHNPSIGPERDRAMTAIRSSHPVERDTKAIAARERKDLHRCSRYYRRLRRTSRTFIQQSRQTRQRPVGKDLRDRTGRIVRFVARTGNPTVSPES